VIDPSSFIIPILERVDMFFMSIGCDANVREKAGKNLLPG
jgi:hypothetical protein